MAYEDKRITGRTDGGTVWGSNPYTDDSDFSVAAVHAGLLLPGETKYIRLTEVGELSGYAGSTRNGVTTNNYSQPWNGLYITAVGEFPADGVGYPYGYDQWYEEFSGTTLKNISKADALSIASLVSNYYLGDSSVVDDVGNVWYGLYRKPDAEGLAYWVREAYLSYNRNPSNSTFVRFFFSASKPGDLDYNRARTASKVFLNGTGVGDFYDRGSSSTQSTVQQPIFNGLSVLEARQVVLDLYASIGRGPSFGTKLSEIDQAGYDFWVNKIVSESLTVSEANTEFTNDINNFIANNPEDPYTRYVLSWRATQESGPPAPAIVNPPSISREVEPIQSTYVPSADGSTRVMWAGIKNSTGLVSIYNNPKNSQGDDSPLNSPLSNLNRIFFDTRFNYLNIVSEANPTINFPFRDINKQNTGKKGKDTRLIPVEGESLYTAFNHNLGFVPSGLLYDLDTNQALSGNTFLQNIDNTSFRLVYLLVDETSFYIKERFFVRGFPLPALSKSFRILVFNNPAGVV